MWTDRTGGVSGAPYASCNLGSHVGDDPVAVAANRADVARRAGLPDPARWWFLDQVHGAAVATVTEPAVAGAMPPAADAAVTSAPGVVLVVLTADCAPLVLADDVAVGVVHTGWKGLLAGVVPAAVAALRAIGSGSVRAALGPCIRSARYEFGRADLDRLVARFGPEVEGRTVAGSPALDLPAAVRRALAEVDVLDLDDPGWCTAADPERWFSHRREGTTGRQGVVVVNEAR